MNKALISLVIKSLESMPRGAISNKGSTMTKIAGSSLGQDRDIKNIASSFNGEENGKNEAKNDETTLEPLIKAIQINEVPISISKESQKRKKLEQKIKKVTEIYKSSKEYTDKLLDIADKVKQLEMKYFKCEEVKNQAMELCREGRYLVGDESDAREVVDSKIKFMDNVSYKQRKEMIKAELEEMKKTSRYQEGEKKLKEGQKKYKEVQSFIDEYEFSGLIIDTEYKKYGISFYGDDYINRLQKMIDEVKSDVKDREESYQEYSNLVDLIKGQKFDLKDEDKYEEILAELKNFKYIFNHKDAAEKLEGNTKITPKSRVMEELKSEKSRIKNNMIREVLEWMDHDY